MKAIIAALSIALPLYAAPPSARPDQLGPAWKSGIYTYDGAGNISAIGTNVYAYDALSRLTGPYQYDAYGNMTGHTVDAHNQLTGAGIQYDAAGNLKMYGGENYAYDASGMMIAKDHDTPTWYDRYLYTADDQRIGVRVGDTWTWTFRDADHDVARQYKSSYANPAAAWTWTEDYVYGPRGMVAAERSDGRRDFHVDHLRTPRLITSDTGASIAQHDYTPFGIEAVAQGEESKKFTGHERDAVPDGLPNPQRYLDYMHARYYDPHEARFLTVDPSQRSAKPQAPQTWNRYVYAANNPLAFSDPDGRELRAIIDHDKTLAAIRLGLPPRLRGHVHSGVNDHGQKIITADRINTRDPIYRNLMGVTASTRVVEVIPAPSYMPFATQDQHGRQSSMSLATVPLFAATLPSSDLKSPTDSLFSTVPGVTQIHIDSGMTAYAQAPVLAAEIGAHALPGINGCGTAILNASEHKRIEQPITEEARRNRDEKQ
jgi:RHS repeat-associated protein